MWKFHKNEQDNNQYISDNMYKLIKYVDKKVIAFNIIVIVLAVITLSIALYYIIDTKIRIDKGKEFAMQIEEYINQQEEIAKQKEIERQAKIPKLTDEGKQNVKQIYKSDTKRVFLTFDDGPSTNTSTILDILKQNNIKATFFVLGVQVQKYPELVKRMYNEGHYIANHGYSHKYSQIYQTPQEVLNEYNQCNQIVANTIGVPEYNSHLFRFPGGSVGGKYAQIKTEAIQILDQNGVVYVDWNAVTGDSETSNPTEEYLMNNLQQTTKEKNSVVLLMHDSQAKKISVDTLPKIIEYLKQQGYEFQNFYNIIK